MRLVWSSPNLQLLLLVILLTSTSLSSSFLTPSPLSTTQRVPESSSFAPSLKCSNVIAIVQSQRQQQPWSYSGKQLGVRSTTTTSLSMGIRSFIKKRILRRKQGGDQSGDDMREKQHARNIEEEIEALIEDGSLEDIEFLEDEEEEENKDEENESGEGSEGGDDEKRLGRVKRETTKEKINRMKSGHMTEEEKAAFLNTAMTRIATQKAKKKGPPIRQAIPSPSEANSTTAATSSASPFPTDSLWSEIIGKGRLANDGNAGSGLEGFKPGQKLNENEKRKYFEMVTDPNRFKTLSATNTTGADDTPPTPPPPAATTPASTSLRSSNNAIKAKTKPAPVKTEKEEKTPSTDDLGTRLGAAAILKEKQDAENRRIMEQKRQEEQERAKAEAAELQRRRLEETRRAQEEQAAKKRAEEEARKKAEEARLAAEEEKRRELQAVQDEYWKKKLKEEKARKERMLSKEEQADIEKSKRQKAEMERQRKLREAEKEAQRQRLREEERRREDKHEGEILRQSQIDSIHDRERNREIMEKSAAKAMGRPPPKKKPSASDVSVSSFVKEQAKKKADLDNMIDMQQQRLKALNSPLPGSGPSTTQPVVTSPNTPKKRTYAQTSAPATSSSDRLDLSKLTQLKKEPKPEDEGENLAFETLPREESSSSERLNLADLTRLKKDEPGDEEEKQEAKKPFRQQVPQKRRVVRQQLPLGNDDLDDEDDSDDLYRSGDNSGMSIGDAMKRTRSKMGDAADKGTDAEKAKSKMWGIDIDKFM